MASLNMQLVWDKHLQNIGELFQNLYEDDVLVDVIISCKDGNLKAHKIVLSACSPYFQRIFSENPCKHPTIIMRGVSYNEMKKLLEYMYRGVVSIAIDSVNTLIQIAYDLEIKGFENFNMQHVQNVSTNENNNVAQITPPKIRENGNEEKITENIPKIVSDSFYTRLF